MAMMPLLSSAHATAKLPIFFFHGVAEGVSAGDNLKANLTAEDRTFHSLSFCTCSCTFRSLNDQVPLAISQIQSIINNSESSYSSGYIFVAHGQGATIARAVIEQMNGHKVTTFISLAGIQNGLFFGPQEADALPLKVLTRVIGEGMLPPPAFNWTTFSSADYRGDIQAALDSVAMNSTNQASYALANLVRSPYQAPWVALNSFLPHINNIAKCLTTSCFADRQRRKTNFIRLKAAHFLGSSRDGVVAPYQSSLFGQYSNVSTASKIRTEFESLEILPMNETTEYRNDTYGLRTLHAGGRLHLYNVSNVTHQCWLRDSLFANGSGETCYFQQVYDKYVYPLLS